MTLSLYIPESTRRRRILVSSAIAAVLGLVIGVTAGRLSAPSVQDQVNSVRQNVRETTAGLRVIALHDEAGTGAGGTSLLLQRTRSELESEFDDAPWLSATTRSALLEQLSALDDRSDEGSPAYGKAAEELAVAIDQAFGA